MDRFKKLAGGFVRGKRRERGVLESGEGLEYGKNKMGCGVKDHRREEMRLGGFRFVICSGLLIEG
jgi:hypothetical protein